MRKISLATLLCVVALSVTSYGQAVWIVDDDGPADFATLQEAVDAASAGDLIRVRADLPPQPYPQPTLEEGRVIIDGKGLDIVGEGTTAPRIAYHVVIRNLPADQDVTLRFARVGYYRIHFEAGLIAPPSLLLEDNGGTTWIEDCDIEFIEGVEVFVGALLSQLHGISATNCEDVVVIRSRIAPAAWNTQVYPPPNPSNRAALRAVNSSVHLYESTFEGMSLATKYWVNGGDGALIEDSFLFAEDCTFTGGDNPKCGLCGAPQGRNGNGISVLRTSEAHAVACDFLPGTGTGLPGQPIVGTVNQVPGPTRSYRIDPAVSKRTATLTAMGPVGEAVFSIVSARPRSLFLPLHGGPLLLSLPFQSLYEGIIPASGTLTKEITLPTKGPFTAQYRQGLFLNGASEAFLASGSMVICLPPRGALSLLEPLPFSE